MNMQKDYKEETRQVERIGFYSLLINLLLTAFKAFLTFFSGSVAIQASTVDSATDSIASLAAWAGLKLSSRKSRKFPYGLYKIENMIQVGMALLILLVGYEIAKDVFFGEIRHPVIHPWIIAGMAISVLVPLVFGWYTIAAGKRTGSPALIADGKHRQADVLSSLAVLAAVVAGYAGLDFQWHGLTVDRIAAGVVLFFVAETGIEIFIGGMRVLLDASLGQEQIEQIREIIGNEPAVTKIQSVSGRSAGRFRFVEATVSLRTADLEKAHKIIDRIEIGICERISHIDRLLIHYEPEDKAEMIAAIPLESDKNRICEHFGEAPQYYIAVVQKSDGRILEEHFARNPHADEEKGKGLKVAKWLIFKDIDRLYTIRSLAQKSPSYVLSDAGVEIVVIGDMSFSDFREQLKISPG